MKQALLAIAVVVCSTAAAADFDTKTGSFEDASRKREIPYKIYYPKPLERQYPIVIVSHGLGGSRDGNEQLGRHLASHGFVAVHIQHEGSDESLLKGVRDMGSAQRALSQSLLRPMNAQNRFQDVPFVVAQLVRMNDNDKLLKGRLDLQALGMAGHSYGAISTMVAAGERTGLRYQSFKVPEVRAGLLLSPSPPRDSADIARSYQDISIPLFHMTGTADQSMVDARSVTPSERTEPYKTLKTGNQYLLVLDKAEHITFSGRRIGTREEAPLDKQHMAAVLNGALAFFKAHLLNDAAAAQWLKQEYKKTLSSADTLEFK